MRWRAIGVVLRDAWPLWVALAGFGMSCFIGYLLRSAGMSSAIRYAGTFLEILGVGAVAFGLRRSRQKFGAPSVVRRTAAWLGRLLGTFRRPKPITLEASMEGTLGILGGDLRARVSAAPGATVERRLESLETNLRILDDEVDRRIGEVKSAIGQLGEGLRRERDDRRIAEQKTSRQIEDVAIGDFQIQVVGLVWLAFGVVCANLPDEVKTLFSVHSTGDPWL